MVPHCTLVEASVSTTPETFLVVARNKTCPRTGGGWTVTPRCISCLFLTGYVFAGCTFYGNIPLISQHLLMSSSRLNEAVLLTGRNERVTDHSG